MTCAPRSATQVRHVSTSAVEPVPSSPPSALQIASGLRNETPATPTPLFAVAATVPATCVPWPLSSAQPERIELPPSRLELARAQSVTRAAPRSWCSPRRRRAPRG